MPGAAGHSRSMTIDNQARPRELAEEAYRRFADHPDPEIAARVCNRVAYFRSLGAARRRVHCAADATRRRHVRALGWLSQDTRVFRRRRQMSHAARPRGPAAALSSVRRRGLRIIADLRNSTLRYQFSSISRSRSDRICQPGALVQDLASAGRSWASITMW